MKKAFCEDELEEELEDLGDASNNDNSDSEEDDDSDTETQIDANDSIEDEIREFEQFEKAQTQAFPGWKRNSCFVHTLQLVVKVFEKNPCFKSTIAKAQKIVKKVNKSCKATEMLVRLAGKKLVSNCPTRWDSMFLMISRLILVKDHLDTVLDKQGWDALTVSQWKQLQAIWGF